MGWWRYDLVEKAGVVGLHLEHALCAAGTMGYWCYGHFGLLVLSGCWPCVLLALNAAHTSMRRLDLCALCAAGAVGWSASALGCW